MRQCTHCLTQSSGRFRNGPNGETLCNACGQKQKRALAKLRQQHVIAKLRKRQFLRTVVFQQLQDSLEELRFCLPEYLDFHIENTADLVNKLLELDTKNLFSESSSNNSLGDSEP
jgi:hypothetical protein